MQSYYTNNYVGFVLKKTHTTCRLLYHDAITMCLLRSQENIYSMPVLLTTCNIQYCRSYYTNYTFRSQENLHSMLILLLLLLLLQIATHI